MIDTNQAIDALKAIQVALGKIMEALTTGTIPADKNEASDMKNTTEGTTVRKEIKKKDLEDLLRSKDYEEVKAYITTNDFKKLSQIPEEMYEKIYNEVKALKDKEEK